jgi:hypothetical protein
MGQLLFQKRFFDSIRSGRKCTTIRRWRGPRVKAGSRAFVPGLGYLLIESVERVTLGQLRAADAIADGFASLSQMRATLREIYPPTQTRADGRLWFRVRFRHELPSVG